MLDKFYKIHEILDVHHFFFHLLAWVTGIVKEERKWFTVWTVGGGNCGTLALRLLKVFEVCLRMVRCKLFPCIVILLVTVISTSVCDLCLSGITISLVFQLKTLAVSHSSSPCPVLPLSLTSCKSPDTVRNFPWNGSIYHFLILIALPSHQTHIPPTWTFCNNFITLPWIFFFSHVPNSIPRVEKLNSDLTTSLSWHSLICQSQ